jgi:hypothetical protein
MWRWSKKTEGCEAIFTEAAKFLAVQGRQGGQPGLSQVGEDQPLATPVGRVGDALEQSTGLSPIDELDGRVVT